MRVHGGSSLTRSTRGWLKESNHHTCSQGEDSRHLYTEPDERFKKRSFLTHCLFYFYNAITIEGKK